MEAPNASSPRRSAAARPELRSIGWRELLAAAVAAAGALGLISLRLDLSRLHVSGLNDQIVYVSVARNLAERGVLASNIIYPATLWQPATRNFFYMPGHMVSLAASYKVLGFGSFSSLLPALAGFVGGAVALYWIAAGRYGRFAGVAAAALLAAVPSVLFFAFTAMSELSFTGVALLALALFCRLRPPLRAWLGPLLLVPPFLFRETAALLVLPMIGVIAEHAAGGAPEGEPKAAPAPAARSGGRWSRAGICLLLAVVVLGALYRSPAAAGRPSLLRANLLGRSDQFVYYDAEAQSSLATASLSDLGTAILANAGQNLRWFLAAPPGDDARLHWCIALLGCALCLGLGLATRDGLLLGGAAMTLATAALVVGLYNAEADRGMRQLLFTLPLGCLAAARAADLLRRGSPRPVKWAGWAALAALLWIGARTGSAAHRALSSLDTWGDQNLDGLERLVRPDDRLALVGPWEHTIEYAFAHHPIQWSFLPQNRFTLDLVARTAPIGTVLLPMPRRPDRVSAADLRSIGLQEVDRVVIRGQRFRLFKRPAP
jgi:hypothetical protein